MNSFFPIGPHVLSDADKARIRRLERLVTRLVRSAWVLLLAAAALWVAHGIPPGSTSGWSELDDYFNRITAHMPGGYAVLVDAIVPPSKQFDVGCGMGWLAVAAMVVTGWLGLKISDIKDPPWRQMICSAVDLTVVGSQKARMAVAFEEAWGVPASIMYDGGFDLKGYELIDAFSAGKPDVDHMTPCMVAEPAEYGALRTYKARYDAVRDCWILSNGRRRERAPEERWLLASRYGEAVRSAVERRKVIAMPATQ